MSRQDLKNFDTIRMAGVVRESIVDGPGLRFAVFCQGCPHGCDGCHNQETHDFDGGYDCHISKIIAAVDQDPLLDGVTFSGGEPFCQSEAFYNLATDVYKRQTCNYCAKVCPMDIGISGSFTAMNYLTLYGDKDAALGQENWLVGKHGRKRADQCIKCGKCEEACPQHIKIRENLEEVKRVLL